MKQIELTQGLFALVDDADFEALNKFSWHAAKRGQRVYAVRKDGWKGPSIYMHRQIMGEPDGLDVAHDNGNGLDNQRHNLLNKTRAANLRGFCKKRVGSTSKFRGVCWVASEDRWRAQIEVGGKNLYLGRFLFEVGAALAYNAAAKEHFGNDAQLNKV